MANIVPPIPYKVDVITKTGKMSDPWVKFFRELYNRAGGSQTTVTDSEDLTTAVNNIKLRLEALEQEPSA